MADYKALKIHEYLFKQGDEPDNMYIVKSGQIGIYISSEGKPETQVATFGVGELIGELALFDKKDRSASAKALCDTSLVVLPYTALEKQLETLPSWVKITMKTLSDKLRDTNRKLVD
ncbi:MAG: Crp/Fnr family transcriptional regulator [Pseudobdellovibrio sp.]